MFSEIYIVEGDKKSDEYFSKSLIIGQTCVEVAKVLRYSQNPRMAPH